MYSRNEKLILAGVQQLAARWSRVQFLRYSLQALFYLLILSALCLLAFPGLHTALVSASLFGASLTIGAALAYSRQPTKGVLAKHMDDAAGLKDSVSSAVELMPAKSPMVVALTQDALHAMGRTSTAEVLPFRLPREMWCLPLPLVLVIGTLLLPSREPISTPDPEFTAAAQSRLGLLEALLESGSRDPLSSPQKDIRKELEDLKAQLAAGTLDRKDTQAQVAEILDKFQLERTAQEAQEKRLRQLAAKLPDLAASQEIHDLLDFGAFQEALNKLKENIAQLEESLAKGENSELSEIELEKLKELLEKLKELEANLASLVQAQSEFMDMMPTLDFLADWEGELGELSSVRPKKMMKPGVVCPDCVAGEP